MGLGKIIHCTSKGNRLWRVWPALGAEHQKDTFSKGIMGKWYVRQVLNSPKSVNGAKVQMRNTDTECYQNARKKCLCFV